jgi:hypothetical protein
MRNSHFGVLLSNGQALDLTTSSGRALPGTLIDCIRAGEAGLASVRAVLEIAEGLLARGLVPDAMVSLEAVELLAPLRPGTPAGNGVDFWSLMYIPIIVAMAAQQNVAAAVSGGAMAMLAGVAAVVAGFALVPVLARMARK